MLTYFAYNFKEWLALLSISLSKIMTLASPSTLSNTLTKTTQNSAIFSPVPTPVHSQDPLLRSCRQYSFVKQLSKATMRLTGWSITLAKVSRQHLETGRACRPSLSPDARRSAEANAYLAENGYPGRLFKTILLLLSGLVGHNTFTSCG